MSASFDVAYTEEGVNGMASGFASVCCFDFSFDFDFEPLSESDFGEPKSGKVPPM